MVSKKNKKRRQTKKSGKSSRPAKRLENKSDDSQFLKLKQSYTDNPSDPETCLEFAEHCQSHGRDSELLGILNPLESSYPFEATTQCLRFDRLLAYAHSFAGNFVDAEQTINRGLKISSNSPDLLYLLCFVRLSLRDFDEAVMAGESYLTVLEQIRENRTVPESYSLTTEHLSQLYNFLATAYREKHDFEKATGYYEKSIESNGRNHLPYLNLAAMHRYQGDSEQVRSVIARGLKHCTQDQELRMLLESLDKSASISACMIVKNEEEMLPGCLDSIRNWVTEIIIVDTGSTDGTIKIAESYGARIFNQPWEGDFSKHRNHSIDQATGDWIFIIDADERVVEEDVSKLLDILNRDEYPIISINVINEYGSEGRTHHTTTFLPSVRFFKRKLNIRYEGIVHNRLEFPPHLEIARADAKLRHLGYDLSEEKMRLKAERTKELLKKQLKANPDDAFALFNHAQVLRGEGTEKLEENGAEIIKSAKRAVELTDPNNSRLRSIHLSCLDQIAWTAFYTGDYKTAIEKCERVLNLKPDYLDPILLMGHIYSRQRDFEQAVRWYKKYLDSQARFDPAKETDSIILIHPDSRVVAYYGLALIAEVTDEIEQAKDYLVQTLKIDPSYLEANAKLGRILKNRSNFSEAETYLQNQLDKSNKTYEAAFDLAEICHNRKEQDRAKNLYRLAIELNPEGVEALIGCGRLCFESGLNEEGLEYFSTVKKLGSADGEIDIRLAQAYYQLGRFEEAANVYQEMLGKAGPNSERCNDLANCFFKLEDFEQAERYYIKASQILPVTPEVFYNLGLTRARLDKYKEAIVSLERFSEVSPDNSEIFQLIGQFYVQISDYSSAILQFEKFLRKNPQDVAGLCNIAECYRLMGQEDAAIMGYRQALKIDPECSLAGQRLGQIGQPSKQV